MIILIIIYDDMIFNVLDFFLLILIYFLDRCHKYMMIDIRKSR